MGSTKAIGDGNKNGEGNRMNRGGTKGRGIIILNKGAWIR